MRPAPAHEALLELADGIGDVEAGQGHGVAGVGPGEAVGGFFQTGDLAVEGLAAHQIHVAFVAFVHPLQHVPLPEAAVEAGFLEGDVDVLSGDGGQGFLQDGSLRFEFEGQESRFAFPLHSEFAFHDDFAVGHLLEHVLGKISVVQPFGLFAGGDGHVDFLGPGLGILAADPLGFHFLDGPVFLSGVFEDEFGLVPGADVEADVEFRSGLNGEGGGGGRVGQEGEGA